MLVDLRLEIASQPERLDADVAPSGVVLVRLEAAAVKVGEAVPRRPARATAVVGLPAQELSPLLLLARLAAAVKVAEAVPRRPAQATTVAGLPAQTLV